MPTNYQVGDRVDRIENREVTGATIISIQETGNSVCVELQYDEGGTGWWPIDCIKPRVDVAPEPAPEPVPEPAPEP